MSNIMRAVALAGLLSVLVEPAFAYSTDCTAHPFCRPGDHEVGRHRCDYFKGTDGQVLLERYQLECQPRPSFPPPKAYSPTAAKKNTCSGLCNAPCGKGIVSRPCNMSLSTCMKNCMSSVK